VSELLKLLERAPTEAVKFADIAATALVADLGVEEMRKKRGADYDTTKYYQVRVKPKDKAQPLEDVLKHIEAYLKKNQKKLGIKRVQINPRSFNSGKYSSVSFEYSGIDFDVVVAAGANKGENFEKELLLKMDNLVAGVEGSTEAEKAFAALLKVDKTFKIANIETVVPRSGGTGRSGDMSPEEIGKTIADIIVKMKKGPDRYISVKNRKGSTLAQFGVSKAFNDDLSINTAAAEWKHWLQPFGLDPKKVQDGLIAASTGIQQPWSDVETPNQVLKPGSPAYKVIEKMWGSNYYYLRETADGFKAFHITPEFVRDVLMKGLKITEVRYPSPARKQINIYLENEAARYKLEVRNPRGKGEVRPTQIQLTLQRSEV
jgi:hypothetical protein